MDNFLKKYAAPFIVLLCFVCVVSVAIQELRDEVGDDFAFAKRTPNAVLLFHKGRPGWIDSVTKSDYDTLYFQAPNGETMWAGTVGDYRALVGSHELTASIDSVDKELKSIFGTDLE